MSMIEMDVLTELENYGTAQNRKVYKRHGVGDNQYGVSIANLKALTKKIKKNHELALHLWDSGNHDARMLATMIADAKRATADLLDTWIGDADNYVLTDAITAYVTKTALIQDKMRLWSASDDEWLGTAGWSLLGQLAMNDPDLPDNFFLPYLENIKHNIHTRKNRVRYAMNNAVIAIGTRNLALKAAALAVAEHIGLVDVDHGETSCKTPNAAEYIQRVESYRQKKSG